MFDIRDENRLFLRVFLGSCLVAAVATIGYLLWGERIITYFYHGGSFLGIGPRTPDARTMQEYLQAAGARFWNNTVIGLPLSVLVLFLLYKLYKRLLTARDASRPAIGDVREGAGLSALLTAGVIYILFTLVSFWPVISTLGTALIGPPEDNMACLWTLDWSHRHVFLGSGSLDFVPDVFYPEGAGFQFHAWSYYNLYVYWGLRYLFEPVTCYNLLILSTFPLAGLGGYLFVRYATGQHWPAVLGGFLFAFCPAHVIRADHHLNLATVQFLPLFLWQFIQAIRRESRTAPLLACGFLILNGLVDWNYFLYCLTFVLFGCVYLAIKRRSVWLRDVAMTSALVCAAAVVVLLPWLWPMLRSAGVAPVTPVGGHNMFVIDVAAFLTPPPDHPLGSISPVAWAQDRFSAWPWENTGYLGIVAVLAVAIWARKALVAHVKYATGAATFALLSLGAQPHLFGWLIPALVPGRLIPALPLLAHSRAPSRNIILVYLFWSLLVSVVVAYLWRTVRPRFWRLAIVVTITVLLVLDYFTVRSDTTPVTLPPAYGQLPRSRERYGILDLPLGYHPTERYLLYQSLHGLPIVGGWASRKLDTTLVDRLEWTDLGIQKAQLTESKVKYVFLHKPFLHDSDIDTAAYLRTYPLLYTDSQTIVVQVY